MSILFSLALDGAIHVFFGCAHTAQHRTALLNGVDALFYTIGFRLADFGSRQRQLSFFWDRLLPHCPTAFHQQ